MELPTELQTQRGRFGSERVTMARAREYVSDNPQCVVIADALDAFDQRRSEVKQNLLEIIATSRQQSSGVAVNRDNVPGLAD